MGPTGSGKTNVSESVIASNARIQDAQFINTLTGDTGRRKAADLMSPTQGVTAYTTPYRGLRLVLVDTPGFDDTYRPDTEILRTFADWLTKRYVIVRTVSNPADADTYTKGSRRPHTQAYRDNLPSPNHRQSHEWCCLEESRDV